MSRSPYDHGRRIETVPRMHLGFIVAWGAIASMLIAAAWIAGWLALNT